MNVIIHRYNSICEPDYIDAFERLGMNVIEDREEMTRKDIPMSERIETLGTMILTEKPVFVFTINFFPYIAQICEKLKCFYVCVSVDCPVAELFDEAIRSPFNRVFLFDYHQYEEVSRLNPTGVFHMPLGVNVDRIEETIGAPKFFTAGEGHQENMKYDISFVGSLYNQNDYFANIYDLLSERIKGYCDGLISAQLLFGGQQLLEESVKPEIIKAIKGVDKRYAEQGHSLIDIDKYIVVNDYLSRHITSIDRITLINTLGSVARCDLFTRSYTSDIDAVEEKDLPKNDNKGVVLHGGVNTLTEMPLVFRGSRININTTLRSIQTGLPQRIWDVLGSGGFLLTNYQAEIDEYFEPGRHLVCYESIDEACEKAVYYLNHEAERMEIAKAGYEYVKANHSIIHRVTEMLRIITQSV